VSRILVVEDDTDIRDLLLTVFGEMGHEAVGAENGEVAMARVGELHPDLIVLDIRMPVMDGRAFASSYRAAPGPHAPILVMTAARDAAASAAALGADEIIAKPFDLNDLMARIERLAGHA
jgi:two-component system response regulator (stage 0 sporulation protein F)